MSAPDDLRRGWCPGMLRPMETRDGLLARLHPRGSVLSASQAQAIAEGARRFGNGLLDLSSRGNIQIRGVTPDLHPHLVESLIAAGLMDGVRSESPFRLTTISPLAGIDPSELIDASALAERIEETGRSITGLHAKMSIVVDGGGAVTLDRIKADIRLVALSTTRVAVGVARPGGNKWVGALAPTAVPAAIGAMISATADGVGQRLREIDDDQLTHCLKALPIDPPEIPPFRAHAPRAGRVPTGDQAAIFLVPPYGRCTADALARAASWSQQFARGEIRLSPFRALVIPFVSAEGCATLARDAGFIVDEDDPRLSISTCSGMEGCARGSTSTHADSNRIAAALPAGISVHISGCPKGCAHPGPADLTLVGDGGAYQVVLGGTARDKPLTRAGIDAVAERLAGISDRTDLMRVFGTGRP
ncbi:precorrin-3B synthase [Microvirga brassicacearum]|uniref:Precorrin-3B synthase n=1 Tax=Microvirga brassicacearum TaxID=2580413 RepID=A0A5N3P6L0_9HYPH|nr:precorrin-3B synthase [Microvirga brassicacearum]KAB0265360.1 precorrin-3B synthase [Microvirga brassicacearum]